jgi:hypothetical protein
MMQHLFQSAEPAFALEEHMELESPVLHRLPLDDCYRLLTIVVMSTMLVDMTTILTSPVIG